MIQFNDDHYYLEQDYTDHGLKKSPIPKIFTAYYVPLAAPLYFGYAIKLTHNQIKDLGFQLGFFLDKLRGDCQQS
jgi:hypothetical protein